MEIGSKKFSGYITANENGIAFDLKGTAHLLKPGGKVFSADGIELGSSADLSFCLGLEKAIQFDKAYGDRPFRRLEWGAKSQLYRVRPEGEVSRSDAEVPGHWKGTAGEVSVLEKIDPSEFLPAYLEKSKYPLVLLSAAADPRLSRESLDELHAVQSRIQEAPFGSRPVVDELVQKLVKSIKAGYGEGGSRFATELADHAVDPRIADRLALQIRQMENLAEYAKAAAPLAQQLIHLVLWDNPESPASRLALAKYQGFSLNRSNQDPLRVRYWVTVGSKEEASLKVRRINHASGTLVLENHEGRAVQPLDTPVDTLVAREDQAYQIWLNELYA